MNRRDTLFALAALGAAPLGAQSQPVTRMPRIGMLWQTEPPPPVHPQMAALLQALKALGWEDGKSVVIEYRYGGNQADRLAAFAAELVGLKVDVIVTNADLSTNAARHATAAIPIAAAVGFPVESGFAKSLARPGGNITGFASLSDTLSVKRLSLLKELLPRLSRVAVLWDPVTHERQPRQVEAAARTLGLEVQILQAQTPGALAPAFEAAAKLRVGALLVLVSPMFLGNRPTLVSLAAQHRIPTIYDRQLWVESGGLVSYGPSQEEASRLTAGQIDKILKGAQPASLPFQQPTIFELAINLKTATVLGIKVPQSVLTRADRVIE